MAKAPCFHNTQIDIADLLLSITITDARIFACAPASPES